MNKKFYSELASLEKIEKTIKNAPISEDEKRELWGIIEEIIHHRILGCALDNLSKEHHGEFLEKVKGANSHEIMEFLEQKNTDIKEKIKNEILIIADEILQDILKSF